MFQCSFILEFPYFTGFPGFPDSFRLYPGFFTKASLPGVSHGQAVDLLTLTALTAVEPRRKSFDHLKFDNFAFLKFDGDTGIQEVPMVLRLIERFFRTFEI
jgi:hypothetical protein